MLFRSALIRRTSVLIDVEMASEGVLLEQVVLVSDLSHQREGYIAKKFIDNTFVNSIYIPCEIAEEAGVWMCDVKDWELQVMETFLKDATLMNEISTTKRGIGIQKFMKETGDIEVIGGKQIQRFHVQSVKGYIEKEYLETYRKKLEFMRQPKIVSQDLVAHVMNPKPHIVLASTYDEKGLYIDVDTVQNTIIEDKRYNPKYIVGLLNSNFVN